MGIATVIKKGAKLADSLFDDAAVQAKNVDGAFDADEWDRLHPRPKGTVRGNPEVKQWTYARSRAKKRANLEGYDSLGNSLKEVYDTSQGWNEEEFLRIDPRPPEAEIPMKDRTPEQQSIVDNHTNRKASTKRKSITPEQKEAEKAAKLGRFNQEKWTELNPPPPGPSTTNEYRAWYRRLQLAREKANSDGYARGGYLYDDLGRPYLNPAKYVDADGNVLPVSTDLPVSEMTPEQHASQKLYDQIARQNRTPEQIAKDLERSSTERAKRALRDSISANPEKIKGAYELAKNLEDITGVAMDVDHLLPLQGDYVSGLHHQDNLFVMPASLNRSKNNAYDPEKYAAIPSSAQRLTNLNDHNQFISNFSDQIAEGIARKQQSASGAAERLNHEIIDPTTRVGRNAQKLWGDDYERYAGEIRKQIGLLGV